MPDTRARLETYKARPDITLLPLYTGDAGGEVFISSDTWPGTGGVLGRTQAQIADAKAKGIQPARSGGFGYMRGPDDAIVEYAGNRPVERFNHVHLYQEDPFCAQLWYEKHLHAPLYEGRTSCAHLTEATCRCRADPIGPGQRSNRKGCSARRLPRSSSMTSRSSGTCARGTSHS